MEYPLSPKGVKAFYPMMIVPGIVLLLAPATVESIMKYFGFHEAMGGLLQVAYFTGGVLGILAITHLIQRFSVRQIAISQVLLLALSLLAASFAPWYPLLLVFFVVAGVANGILIAFPGVYVTRTAGAESHHDQNILYGTSSREPDHREQRGDVALGLPGAGDTGPAAVHSPALRRV
jgi:MFS family permease